MVENDNNLGKMFLVNSSQKQLSSQCKNVTWHNWAELGLATENWEQKQREREFSYFCNIIPRENNNLISNCYIFKLIYKMIL